MSPPSTEERQYCSDLCLAAGEPMAGTADPVDVWLLLEYKPVWKPKAINDNDLANVTREWLQQTVQRLADAGLKARPQFIRRPELDTETTTLMVARDGKLFHCEANGYDAITNVDVLAHDMKPVGEQQYFVCTNGQRDLCCARYGLPTYAKLRETVGARAWQTTHLGGHRFAPNVLTLPQGVLYGRVVADEVVDFVAAVESGELSLPHVRGRSIFPKRAQVAEVRAGTQVQGLASIEGDNVVLLTADGETSIRVAQGDTPYEIIASCGDEKTKPIYPFIET